MDVVCESKNKMKTTSICIVFALISCGLCAYLPKNWKRCKVSPDSDYLPDQCLKESITEVAKHLGLHGEKTLSVGDFDPMKIKKMVIGQKNPNGAVRLKTILKNVDMFGLSRFKIKYIQGKLSSPDNWHMEIKANGKFTTLISDYQMDGQVLILPIVGSGKSNITLKNIEIVGIMYGKSEMKDGKQYLKLTNQTLSIDIKGLDLQFDNLLNDENVSKSMNLFLNENWSLLYQELRPAIEKSVGKEIRLYSAQILEKIPFKEIFIVD